MAWVRIDDHFYRHPKVVMAGPMAMALHIAALCYSSDYLTDGFVPSQVVSTLINFSEYCSDMPDQNEFGEQQRMAWAINPLEIAQRLEQAGVWEGCEGGWRIHDYLEFQPSRDHILREREQVAKLRAEAGKRGADARWNGKNGKRDGKPIATAMAKAWQTDGPVPDPVPRNVSPNGDMSVSPIFEAYRKAIQPQARLLPAAAAKIRTRLQTFSLQELTTAIEHFAADLWEMEHNAHRGAAWFFDSDKRVEQYVNMVKVIPDYKPLKVVY